jgi:O-antigen/teichoic acid export membrane protein
MIGIVMVPMYVRYMGVEAYGLVGFFAMLQAWFQLLDMGLTPTMARETARFNGGATDALSLRRLLRAMEGIFIGVAVVGAAAMLAGAGYIAGNWLKVQQLSLNEVRNAIMLMAGTIALRWVCGLYRGVVSGFERQVWLSGFNIAMATARFVLVIPYFIFVGTSPTEFFCYQLTLAVIEIVALVLQTYKLLPFPDCVDKAPWQWAPLRGVLKFSMSIAFTTTVWVLITQTDKLILSGLLSLSEYAYFTLAVLIAGGVSVISGPISGALLPRMSKLAALSDDKNLIDLYRMATQLLAVIAIPATLVLTFFSDHVLLAWTGSSDIAKNAATVMSLYALGNGFLALSAFPYYLQFAKGDLKLHMIGNFLFVLVLLPSLILATKLYGATGAGCAWLGANMLYFVVWVPRVHKRFSNILHNKWICHDIGMVAAVTLSFAIFIWVFFPWPNERIPLVISICGISLTMVFIASIASSFLRVKICKITGMIKR